MDKGSPGQGRTCRTFLRPCKGKVYLWMWAALLHSPSSAAFIPGEEGWEVIPRDEGKVGSNRMGFVSF